MHGQYKDCKALLPIAALALLALNGCSRSKEPAMIVEMCLGDQKGLRLFIETMRQIASTEHMTFIDNSAKTQRELDVVGQSNINESQDAHVLNIGIEGDDGLGVTAGNLGLARYQVALGFTKGSSDTEGSQFADVVVRELRTKWMVTRVPAGKAAMRASGCD